MTRDRMGTKQNKIEQNRANGLAGERKSEDPRMMMFGHLDGEGE